MILQPSPTSNAALTVRQIESQHHIQCVFTKYHLKIT